MHQSAMDLGAMLFGIHGGYLNDVLDVGSQDINGSLRSVCPKHVNYVGIDMAAGNGVDIVLEDPYKYPFEDNKFDMVVSTSCFEHDPMFWVSFLEILRVTKDGGLIYINAPTNGPYHAHPWDNWRFYPDAAHALAMWGTRSGADVTALESFVMPACPPWNDYVMVFAKGFISVPDYKFLSDRIPGICNLVKITHSKEMRFHTTQW